MDAIGEVTQRALVRTRSRVVEQIADLAVPLILEENPVDHSICSTGAHQGPHRGAYWGRAGPRSRRTLCTTSSVSILWMPVRQIQGDVLQHVPERVLNLVGEQIVDVPVPQIQDDGLQLLSEQVQNCTVEQTIPCASDFRGKSWKLCFLRHRSSCIFVRRSRFWTSLCFGFWRQLWKLGLLHHRSACRIASGEQIADSPVPQFMEAVVDVLPSLPRERVQNRTQEQRVQEQIMDFPVPRILEAVVEVVPSTPKERVQEQTVDFPVPRITEEIVDRIPEQTVGSPVPQITEEIVELYSSADCGFPRASDHGGNRGSFS